MDKVKRYAALNTKIRALYGDMLNDEDYNNLLSKRDVNEVAAYLKQNTHYKDILDSVNENMLNRHRLENLLKESHINSLKKLSYYFHDKYKLFYETIYVRFEIEDLKAMMRGVKTGTDNRMHKERFVHIGMYSSINVDNLLSSRSMQELINNLKGTVYYDYLRPIKDGKYEDSLFAFEMTLDLAYFSLFYKNMDILGREDRQLMEEIQGRNIDLLNIQWIYRGLKFYNLPPEELFNYTIINGKAFNRNDIKALCYSASLDEFQKRVLGTEYDFLFDHEKTRDILMERRILRYQYFMLKSIKSKYQMNISQVIAYELLLEMEVRDIISVIESIRYGMPSEEARRFLIRKL